MFQLISGRGVNRGETQEKPSGGPRPSIGVALSGGAARGWAHIGVMQALAEAGYVPDVIAGTSIGAVVGALILLCKAADSAAAEAAVASIEQAIAQRLPTFEIALDLAHLASAYLQSPAPDQKQMHKLVKEAATFLARTASLRIPPA